MAEGVRQPLAFEPGSPENTHAYENLTPVVGRGEALAASFDLEAMNTLTGSLYRMFNREDDPTEEKLPANELNKMYPGVTFSSDMKKSEAMQIVAQKMTKQELEKKVSLGPQDYLQKVGNFGAGIVAHAGDPLEFAGGVLAGAAVGAAAMGTRVAAALGVGVAERTAAQTFTRIAVDGFAGQALNEPILAAAHVQDLEDYTVKDAFINAVSGALGFAAIHVGAGAALKGARFAKSKLMRTVENMPQKRQAMMVDNAVAQLANDRPVNLDHHIADHIQETQTKLVDHNGDVVPYKFEPAQKTSAKPVYSPRVKGEPQGIHEAGSAPVGDDFGVGIYLTDSPHVANGQAAGKFSDGGIIIEGQTKGDLNLMDLNKEAAQELRDAVKNLSQSVEGRELEFPPGVTGKEFLEHVKDLISSKDLPENFLDTVNQKLKAQGFDGYRHDGSESGGRAHEQHNAMMIFDGTKLEERARLSPDSSVTQKAVPPVEVEQVRNQALDIESKIGFDSQEFRKFETEMDAKPIETKLSELQAEETLLMEEAQSLKEQGLLDKADEGVLQDIAEAKKDAELQEKIIKGATYCLSRSG